MLIKCLDCLEIKNTIFNLNGNSAPSPDDFGGVFILVGTLLGQMFAKLFNSFLRKNRFFLK